MAVKNEPTKEIRFARVAGLALIALCAAGAVSSAGLADDAGVLAFAKSDGDAFLLLGLEDGADHKYCPGLVWKDFVGGVLPKDQGDRRAAAAREFAEETGCVFGT